MAWIELEQIDCPIFEDSVNVKHQEIVSSVNRETGENQCLQIRYKPRVSLPVLGYIILRQDDSPQQADFDLEQTFIVEDDNFTIYIERVTFTQTLQFLALKDIYTLLDVQAGQAKDLADDSSVEKNDLWQSAYYNQEQLAKWVEKADIETVEYEVDLEELPYSLVLETDQLGKFKILLNTQDEN